MTPSWWLNVGRNAHPQIYQTVPCIIAVPVSNDGQERTFSACTHFDDALRQRLKEGRFEMGVLLAVNESLLNQVDVDEKRFKEIIKEVIDACGFDGQNDLGIDFESEDFIFEE